MPPMRFTLSPRRWYASEFIGDEFGTDKCSYSAIKVHEASPTKDGSRTLRIHFYHRNYPEGVRDKVYTVQTLERGSSFLLLRSREQDPVRILLIYDIDAEWMIRHFPGVALRPEDDVHAWLEGHP